MPEWILRFAGDCVEYVHRGKRKDVVILGSSLIAAVSIRLEQPPPKEGGTMNLNVDGNIYEADLATKHTPALTVAFAAVPGAMVSDQRLIFSKLAESGKSPSILVYTFAPRDFIDNEVGDKLNDTPTQRVFKFYESKISFLPTDLSIDGLLACLEKHRSFIDLLRRQTYRQIKAEACKITGHAENLWTATQESKKKLVSSTTLNDDVKATEKVGPELENQNKANILKEDLDLYRKRYLPVNQARLKIQLNNLELMLAQAKRQNIKVLLFGMPISKENASILPAETRTTLANEINRIARQNNARLVDLNSQEDSTFQLNDFLDSVHLNKSGAEKLLPILSKDIASL